MPKSKEFIDSSDEGSDEESGAAAAKTTTTTKKPIAKSSSSSNDPSAKRAKTSDQSDDGVAWKRGPNGDRLYEIGKMRYVSVSDFRGKPYVNIREYYDDKGTEKPGKKGISLTGDQWEKLKSLINQVDKDLKKSK